MQGDNALRASESAGGPPPPTSRTSYFDAAAPSEPCGAGDSPPPSSRAVARPFLTYATLSYDPLRRYPSFVFLTDPLRSLAQVSLLRFTHGHHILTRSLVHPKKPYRDANTPFNWFAISQPEETSEVLVEDPSLSTVDVASRTSHSLALTAELKPQRRPRRPSVDAFVLPADLIFRI